MALYLVLTHLLTDSGLLDREHSTETAALIGTLWFYDLTTLYQLQQILDLIELGDMLLRGRTES